MPDVAVASRGVLPAMLSNIDLVAVIHSIWFSISSWVASGYQQAPLVMVGLSSLLIAPALALAGLALRRPPAAARAPATEEVGAPSRHVWIAVEDDPDTPRARVKEMLRIGRHDDNDLCLPNKTVHRYHALIYRSDDAQYMIMDLSGASGNGIKVNGHAVARSALTGGDRVELGEVRLRFETACS